MAKAGKKWETSCAFARSGRWCVPPSCVRRLRGCLLCDRTNPIATGRAGPAARRRRRHDGGELRRHRLVAGEHVRRHEDGVLGRGGDGPNEQRPAADERGGAAVRAAPARGAGVSRCTVARLAGRLP